MSHRAQHDVGRCWPRHGLHAAHDSPIKRCVLARRRSTEDFSCEKLQKAKRNRPVSRTRRLFIYEHILQPIDTPDQTQCPTYELDRKKNLKKRRAETHATNQPRVCAHRRSRLHNPESRTLVGYSLCLNVFTTLTFQNTRSSGPLSTVIGHQSL